MFKCSESDCPWHAPIKSGEIESFGEPVPVDGPNGEMHYKQGEDPDEKFIPSKLEDPSKRNHGMPFMPTAQTALNVGTVIKCTECRKPRLIYICKEKAGSNKFIMYETFSKRFSVCVWYRSTRCSD